MILTTALSICIHAESLLRDRNSNQVNISFISGKILFSVLKAFMSTISVYPNLESIEIGITQKTETNITVTFKQFTVADSLAEYYFYRVECRRQDTDSLLPNLPQLPHNSSTEEVSVTINGLASGTSHIIKIIPYREVAHSRFNNAKLEAGTPSQDVTVVTGTFINYLV